MTLRFTDDGLLPPGDYEMSCADLRTSLLVLGSPDAAAYPKWDVSWRKRLVDNLEVLVAQLWQVGVTEIFVDGSFAEDKDHPNDIDGSFVCDLLRLARGDLERELNLLDPHKVWTWDPAARRPYRGYPKKQLPMWHQYRVELYPHLAGLRSGFATPTGTNSSFPPPFDARVATAGRAAS